MHTNIFTRIYQAAQYLRHGKIKPILKFAIKPIIASKLARKVRKVFPVFYSWCDYFPKTITILSDGSVTTCCFDPFGKNVFGSVYEQDIAEIWNKQVKNILFGDLYDLKGCRGCQGNSFISKRKDYLKWQAYVNKYPVQIQIEIMGRCNYGCCCAVDIHKYRNTKPDLDKIFGNIKSFLPRVKSLALWNWGEPLLHEGFCDFVKRCRKESSALRMYLNTNGMLMDEKVSRCLVEEKVTKVAISIHGGPGTENMLKYSTYGADYNKVIANIKQLTDLKKMYNSKLPEVYIKAILFNWNDTDELMDKLKKDGEAAGADKVYWSLDCSHGAFPRSSKRFTPGSDELKKLIERGDYED